jgi:hypothetical protein
MATFTWIGGNPGNSATDAANWYGDAVPTGNGNTVIINAGTAGPPAGFVVFNLTGGTLTSDTIDVAGPYNNIYLTSDTLASDVVTLGTYGVMGVASSTIDSTALTIDPYAQVAITDSQINTSTVALGNSATLTLTGSAAASMIIDESQNGGGGDNKTKITQTGSTAVINVVGTLDSNAMIMANTPGGSLTLNIAQDGSTEPGLFFNQGAILDFGETINITADGNSATRFANNGFIFIDGAAAAASVVLSATQSPISGDVELLGGANGATLVVDTNMPGTQVITFGDGNGLLQIDATNTLANNGGVKVLADFFSRINGFQAGDTIDLVGINPTGLSWTYSTGASSSFGAGVLDLVQSGNTIGLLRIGGQFVNGSGSFGVSNTTNFVFASDGSGGTDITLQSANAISGGTTVAVTPTLATFTGGFGNGTLDWSSGAAWTGGSIPGQYQTANFVLTGTEVTEFTGGSPTNYIVKVDTAETAGGVNFGDPFATLDVTAPLTLSPAPGQSGGGQFTMTQGTVEIASGGTITTTRLYGDNGGFITLDSGGSLNVSGVPSLATGIGLSGIDIEGQAGVSGGTITSSGNFVVGQNANASVTVDAGSQMTVSYTSVGGQSVVNPFGTNDNAYLDITGAGTVYKDAGGDATTPYSGAMLVGGGMPSTGSVSNSTTSSVGSGGTGDVQVDQGATLEDSSFAVLGLRTGASGNVQVSNGAQWVIGTASSVPAGSLVIGSTTIQSQHLPWLTVGLGGSGNLNINGGTVTLGAGESSGTFKMTIGEGGPTNTSAFGSVNMSGGLLNTGGGPMAIGLYGNGNLSLSNSATVVVGSSVTTGFGFGAVLGFNDTVISGTTIFSNGQLNIGGGSGKSLFSDTGAFIDGLNGTGNVQVSSGGSLSATGMLFIGGSGSGHGASQGSQFTINGGTASVSSVQLYAGNTLSVGGSGQLSVGSFGAPTAGQLDIASLGGTLQGAGFVSVSSGSSSIFNNGLVNANIPAATLELAALLEGSGTYQVGGGAILRLDQGVNSGVVISETANTAAVVQDVNPYNFFGAISGFYGSNTLDLTSINFASNSPVASYTPNANAATGGTITVNANGLGIFQFDVTGYHPGGFYTQSDGAVGGTAVLANDAAPCFAAGTCILTTSGEAPVEALRAGDLLPTLLGGGLRRIKWIGQTRIDLERHARPEKVAPIRVRAHAFAPDMPHRDLVLSPDHAVALDGVLIPIHLLVNGASIVRLPAAGAVTYFHVELDAHDVLLAEGLPAESYLDTGNRGLFAGSDAARPLHPDLCADLSARAWDELACAPLLLGGPVVEAAHRRLAARAETLGHRLTDDPALRVVADGVALAVEATKPGVIRVRLPAGARDIRLISRSVVPEELNRSTDDRRRLGVAVAELRRDGTVMALHGPAFAAGFHPMEDDGEAMAWRWTDGAALLRLKPLARASVLELRLIAGWRRYHDTAVAAKTDVATAMA